MTCFRALRSFRSISDRVSDHMPCTARIFYIVYLLFAIVELLVASLAAVFGVLTLLKVTFNTGDDDVETQDRLKFLQGGDEPTSPVEAREGVPRLYLAVASTIALPVILTFLAAFMATYVSVKGFPGEQLELEQPVGCQPPSTISANLLALDSFAEFDTLSCTFSLRSLWIYRALQSSIQHIF